MKVIIAVFLAMVWSWAGTIIGVEFLPDNFAYELMMMYTVVIGDAAIIVAAFRKEWGVP